MILQENVGQYEDMYFSLFFIGICSLLLAFAAYKGIKKDYREFDLKKRHFTKVDYQKNEIITLAFLDDLRIVIFLLGSIFAVIGSVIMLFGVVMTPPSSLFLDGVFSLGVLLIIISFIINLLVSFSALIIIQPPRR